MVSSSGATTPGLRERKRQRTRQALIDTATDLFQRYGYDRTTIADVAAAAEVGTRTFFSYFASKEDLLFPAVDTRIQAVIDAITTRRPGERPTEVLLRALGGVAADADLTCPLAALRLELIRTVPAVQRRGLQLQHDAQHKIAEQLHAAFPDDLDEVIAAALVGSFMGAVTAALQVLLADLDSLTDRSQLSQRLNHATAVALQHWSAPPVAQPTARTG